METLQALQKMSAPIQIIAHRGASADAPENTLAAIELAWQHKADGVEIDIRVSHDGRAVVIHDADTARTAGLERPVCEQTLADLRRLDAGRWKANRWAGERIPLLEEVLAAVPPAKRLIIEVKCGTEIIPPLCEALRTWQGPPHQIALMSFSREVCCALTHTFQDHPVWWLIERPKHSETEEDNRRLAGCVEMARRSGFQGMGFHFEEPLSAPFIQSLQHAGLCAYAWTVDKAPDARRLRNIGVNALATNRPAQIRRALSEP